MADGMGSTLVVGQDFKVVGDEYWTWSVRAGRFVRADGSHGRYADVCVIEAARAGGGRPFRIAVQASAAAQIGAGILEYCRAFSELGADQLLQR